MNPENKCPDALENDNHSSEQLEKEQTSEKRRKMLRQLGTRALVALLIFGMKYGVDKENDKRAAEGIAPIGASIAEQFQERREQNWAYWAAERANRQDPYRNGELWQELPKGVEDTEEWAWEQEATEYAVKDGRIMVRGGADIRSYGIKNVDNDFGIDRNMVSHVDGGEDDWFEVSIDRVLERRGDEDEVYYGVRLWDVRQDGHAVFAHANRRAHNEWRDEKKDAPENTATVWVGEQDVRIPGGLERVSDEAINQE